MRYQYRVNWKAIFVLFAALVAIWLINWIGSNVSTGTTLNEVTKQFNIGMPNDIYGLAKLAVICIALVGITKLIFRKKERG